MKLIVHLFPEREDSDFDAAALAAVSTAIGTVYPGTKITKVEEVK